MLARASSRDCVIPAANLLFWARAAPSCNAQVPHAVRVKFCHLGTPLGRLLREACVCSRKSDRANPVDNHSERPDYRAEQGRFDATTDRLCDKSQVTPSTDLNYIAFRLGVGRSLTEPETWRIHRVAMLDSQVVVYDSVEDSVEGSEVRIKAR